MINFGMDSLVTYSFTTNAKGGKIATNTVL